jgi:hypothetical protein
LSGLLAEEAGDALLGLTIAAAPEVAGSGPIASFTLGDPGVLLDIPAAAAASDVAIS